MGYFFAFHFALSRHRGSPYGGLRTSRDVYAVAPPERTCNRMIFVDAPLPDGVD